MSTEKTNAPYQYTLDQWYNALVRKERLSVPKKDIAAELRILPQTLSTWMSEPIAKRNYLDMWKLKVLFARDFPNYLEPGTELPHYNEF